MDFFMTGEIAPLFVRWSLPHWAALGIVALAAGGLLWGCRRLRMESRLLVGKVLGSLFLLTFLMETFGRIVREHWEPWQDRLPLHFCSLMALVCFIALWFRTPWACAVAYFGVLTASVQGLITPMLHDGFPSAAFFAFFKAERKELADYRLVRSPDKDFSCKQIDKRHRDHVSDYGNQDGKPEWLCIPKYSIRNRSTKFNDRNH